MSSALEAFRAQREAVEAAALGVGYVWAARPGEAELVSLRERVQLLDFVGHRVITMTPTERRQFDTLMKWSTSPGR
jgi:hypothetical protein